MTDDELVDRIARRTLRLLGDEIRPELRVGRLTHEATRSIIDRLRVLEPLEDETVNEPETPRDFNLLGEIRFDDPIQQTFDVYECLRCGCLVVTTSRHIC